MKIKVAVGPNEGKGRDIAGRALAARRMLEDAGFEVVDPARAEGIVWVGIYNENELAEVLAAAPSVRWVQLPRTGVDNFLPLIRERRDIVFTCAKGAFAPEVAEHALTLALSVMRRLPEQARERSWNQVEPVSIENKRVTILGGGYIAEHLIRMLGPFGCEITAVRRSEVPVSGARRTVNQSALHEVLPQTDLLVLALSLTPETAGIVGRRELALLPKGSYLVNVARGQHVVMDDLVEALRTGHLAGAGLDVTDPEPLPAESPLWQMDNVAITSHCANSLGYVVRRLAERALDNAQRLSEGRELVGIVDADAGY